MHELRIDERRFRRDFNELAEIGSTGDGGVHRPSLSAEHLEARRWFRERIERDGLEFRTDGAGNHSAVLSAAQPAAPTLLMGSHLDSVLHGGRFDGALGVVAAYEALRTVRDAGLELPVHIEAIDFTDEEGTLVGLLGSLAVAGAITREGLASPRGGREELEQGMCRAGITDESIIAAARATESLAGFLELHIEQGPRLVDGGIDIGIVSAIVGMTSIDLVFVGREDHAGTTPMGARRDAGLAAATFITEATARVRREFADCVVNFGRVELAPGAYNIVPGRAELGMEFRAPSEERMSELEASLLELARAIGPRHEVQVNVRPLGGIAATPCADVCRAAFAEACGTLGLSHTALLSGAGHDTMALAHVCPAGMIFVPSTGGSHSPREHAEWPACVNGANALLHAALRMAR
jgi:hydantoinase/carbamoylase family amidase